MRLDSFRLRNQKCFFDSGTLSLSPGINVVVGINNVGKSALLEALALDFVGNPTRNMRTKKLADDPVDPRSTMELEVSVNGADLRRFMLVQGATFQAAIPNNLPVSNESEENHLEAILSSGDLSFAFNAIAVENSGPSLFAAQNPSSPNFSQGSHRVVVFSANPSKDGFKVQQRGLGFNPSQDIGIYAASLYKSTTYRFRAERMNIGRCPSGVQRTLASNAHNLPEVLANLQSNHALFADYNSLVRQILTTVHHVSVNQASQTEVEIYVWQHPTLQHLATPLEKCGTGIAQILSILYVLMTSSQPRTIIIDEPNSFLHPGAARKLMETLRDFPKQQFIIATHSPEVIKSIMPERLLKITWNDGESSITSLNATDVAAIANVLKEVGARVSDVTAADNIIWVEGESEEECFPIILREMAKTKMFGSAFVALHDTGSFSARRVGLDSITRLYEKLSKGGGLVPRAIGFSFDREGRSEADIKQITTKHPNIFFLPRRMFENYLMDCDALAHVINLQLDPQDVVTPNRVMTWIKSHGAENKYFSPLAIQKDILSDGWIQSVKSARLSEDLFQDITAAKAEFVKTRDDVLLSQWLLANRSDLLKPLCEYLQDILGKCGASVARVLDQPEAIR